MDAHLIWTDTRHFILYTLMACACVGASAAAAATDMTDPTLPPAPARAQSASSANATTTPVEPLRLQMILRGPGEQRSALIDGRVVQIGDPLNAQGEGSARVLRITTSTVVLRRADGSTQTLELAPETAQAVSLTHATADRPMENKR